MGSHTWSSIGGEELLNADSRPSFVIEDFQTGLSELRVVYRNHAFLQEFNVSKTWEQKRSLPEDAYREYLEHHEPNAPSFLCGTYLWTVTSLRNRWSIVSANVCIHHTPDAQQYTPSKAQFQEDPQLALWKRNYKINDWTAITIPPTISPWSRSLRARDWSRTPLGPIATWPAQLRVMANLVCVDTNPAVLWWGET